jgi:hypothetical protein
MPTGLTGAIYEGKDMTLRGFALRCATQTGYGSVWTDRGEKAMPLDKAPVMKEKSDHREALQEAMEELERWQQLKAQPEELRKRYDAYRTKVDLENIGLDKRYDEKHDRYQTMIDKVTAWQVTENYLPLKDLMLRQLRESMEYDCRDKEHRYYNTIAPMDEWIEAKIKNCQYQIDYYKERIAEDEKYVREANEYFKGLYALLDEAEPIVIKED